MSEDKKVQIQRSVTPVTEKKTETAPVTSTVKPVEGVEPTHKFFKPPKGLEIMQPVIPPDHLEAARTGAQEHPPKLAEVSGDSIEYPVGVEDLEAARRLRKGNVKSGLAAVARVAYRQGIRLQGLKKIKKTA